MPVTIQHIRAPTPLEQYIEHFWCITSTQQATLRVVPDGCWDIVINPGESAEFVGPMTGPFLLPLEPGEHHYGVRFKLGTYPIPLKKDISECLDKVIPVNKLVDITPETDKPLKLLEELVTAFVTQGLLEQDEITHKVIERLSAKKQQSLLSIYAEIGVSPATIERKFKKYVGVTPQQLRRITRQLAVNVELMNRAFPQLGSLAADFGYVDQAHMTHELRLLSGATPSNLHKEYDDYIQYKDSQKEDTADTINIDKELL